MAKGLEPMDAPDYRLLLERNRQLEVELRETRQMNIALMNQIDALAIDMEFYKRQAKAWLDQISHQNSAPTANNSEQLKEAISRFLTTARIEGGYVGIVSRNNLD